ncbi:hypothetical protein FOXB_00113, partial [Fusarium oxysporum f. sp. conglutinans Fo5176]
TREKLPRK